MKARKAKDLKELSDKELMNLLDESKETLARQRIQNSLKQLTDTAGLNVLRKDIARIQTIINERIQVK
ncbi:MAG: 50S ribosomal protein L29 [Ignavibacteria bacterium GWF2_33_9]|nr:MAG: 50S ribosomal protein L29 [Ignavibacteria bacterium GWF2_33_9]